MIDQLRQDRKLENDMIARRIVEHEMFVRLFPNWKGQRQVRIVKLDENELHLSPRQPQLFNGSLKAAAITWRRARPNV